LTTLWVLENIDQDRAYYSKFNILCLFSSVKLYKKHHPDHKTVFYCDPMTFSFVRDLGAIHLWDEVVEFKFDLPVNKKIFWASSKLHILSQINEPIVIIDNDSLVYTNLDSYLKDEVVVSNLEDGKGYYPLAYDPYIRKLSYKQRWKADSVNVSFLYLPDPTFTKIYTKLSIDIMKELTQINAPDSRFLIFAEQLILRHLLDKNNIPFKSLISTSWDCQAWQWGKDHDKGVWPFPESNKYYFHYGPLKTFFKDLKYKACDYESEIQKFKNIIQFDIDDSKFLRL
jgi:hypothetical protein